MAGRSGETTRSDGRRDKTVNKHKYTHGGVPTTTVLGKRDAVLLLEAFQRRLAPAAAGSCAHRWDCLHSPRRDADTGAREGDFSG